MPVFVSGRKQPDWKNPFDGMSVNHKDGVFHDRTDGGGVRVSGGAAVASAVERDFGVGGRSSSFTTRQEMEVTEFKSRLTQVKCASTKCHNMHIIILYLHGKILDWGLGHGKFCVLGNCPSG